MNNKKPPKTLIWKYSTVKIFISVIIFLILFCLVGAWYLCSIGNDFGYSALLNVFGGLFTGLILLSYQYLSNKHLREANMIVEKLKQLNEIPTFHANELDFCTDYTRPSQEQLEDSGIELATILEDKEGTSCALETYNEEIRKAEKQLNVIKDFLNNVLRISLDYSTYENKLTQTKQFFSTYTEEIKYAIPPYTDTPGNSYEIRGVYKNKEEVLIEEIYQDWIQKMNDLEESTKVFDNLFMESKDKILGLHNKNLNIIH